MKVKGSKMEESVVIAFGKKLNVSKIKRNRDKAYLIVFCKVPFKLPLISVIFEIWTLFFISNAIVDLYLQLNIGHGPESSRGCYIYLCRSCWTFPFVLWQTRLFNWCSQLAEWCAIVWGQKHLLIFKKEWKCCNEGHKEITAPRTGLHSFGKYQCVLGGPNPGLA